MTGRFVRITVPASTANLGSGFDALGLALGLYDVVEARSTDGGLVVEVCGEGAGAVPTDETHLVVRALRAACARIGYTPPGLALRCHNVIPHARGLGSSAAAVVAGVAAGYALAGRELDEVALDIAAGFEGHADNVAASLYGGAVIVWRDGSAHRFVRLTPHPRLCPVVLVPAEQSVTNVTRGLLPEFVPHTDAAFAVGRAALAVHALTAAPDLLLPAIDDRLHQSYREPAWPMTLRLVRDLRAAGVPAAVSGAGPTVLAFPSDGRLPSDVDYQGFSPLALDVDRAGVRTDILG